MKLIFNISFFLLIQFLNVFTLKSQEVDFKALKNWQLKGYAKNAIKIGDTYSAIDYYKEYVTRNANSEKYNFLLAQLYSKAHDYLKAKKIYKHLISNLKSKKYEILLNYAQTLKALGEYDEALKIFALCEDEIRNKKINNSIQTLITNEKLGCLSAIRQKDTIVSTKIIHLNENVNKAGIEFSPIILNDSTFAFGSSNMAAVNYHPVENKSIADIRKFRLAKRNKDSVWTVNENPPAPFYNFVNENTGNGVFSIDKTRFYFTRCAENWKSKMICHIYVSELVNNTWNEPVALGNQINVPDYSSTQPAIGSYNNDVVEVLYFASDRKGGAGGYDIWYSVYNKKTQKYSDAFPIVGFMNTAGNEMSPYYDVDSKTLYFSSDFLPGFGGFDIYQCTGEVINWTKAENLGYPLNSSFDDLFFTLSGNKKYGFFSSNRNGSVPLKNENCCDDIFYFQTTNQAFSLVQVNDYQKNITDILVKDTTIQKRENIPFIAVETKLIPVTTDFSSVVGKFKFDAINDKNDLISRLNHRTSDSIENKSKSSDSIRIDDNLERAIVLKNILYDYNKSVLTEQSKAYIDTTLLVFMNQFPTVKIEILSHTDNIGSDAYNLRLSQNRAKSVVNYLISKGIKKERLTSKGFGSQRPVARNSNADGSDNPANRKLNRRTEFVIKRK